MNSDGHVLPLEVIDNIILIYIKRSSRVNAIRNILCLMFSCRFFFERTAILLRTYPSSTSTYLLGRCVTGALAFGREHVVTRSIYMECYSIGYYSLPSHIPSFIKSSYKLPKYQTDDDGRDVLVTINKMKSLFTLYKVPPTVHAAIFLSLARYGPKCVHTK